MLRKADRLGDAKAPLYSPQVRKILGRLHALADDLQRLKPAYAAELQGAFDRITAYALIVGDDIECPLHAQGIDWTLAKLDLCDGATGVLNLENTRSHDEIERTFRAEPAAEREGK